MLLQLPGRGQDPLADPGVAQAAGMQGNEVLAEQFEVGVVPVHAQEARQQVLDRRLSKQRRCAGKKADRSTRWRRSRRESLLPTNAPFLA